MSKPISLAITPWPIAAALSLQFNRQDCEDGCSHWVGLMSKEGYPIAIVYGQRLPAHRLAAALYYGPDAISGKDIHHTCFQKCCVRADHLSPVTASEHTKIHLGLMQAPFPPRATGPELVYGPEIIKAVKTCSPRRPRRTARRAA